MTYRSNQNPEVDPRLVIAGAGVLAVGAGFYAWRMSQRKELVRLMKESLTIEVALTEAPSWAGETLEGKAAEYLPLFGTNSAEAAFGEVIADARAALPPGRLEEGTGVAADVLRLGQEKLEDWGIWDKVDIPFFDYESWRKG